MAIDWVEGRVPDPPLEDVVRSSLGVPTEGYEHQLNFLYPREGGIESLVRGSSEGPRIRTGFRVTSVRRRGGTWVVTDGREEREFDRLVSTIRSQSSCGPSRTRRRTCGPRARPSSIDP